MEAVIFDMDGVIVDSEQYWHEMEGPLFQEVTPEGIDIEDAKRMATGRNFREIYEILDEEYGVTVSREEFLQRYYSVADTIYNERAEVMDGFHELLTSLHEHGVTIALVSSSPREWIDTVMNRFDIDGFNLIVSADTLKVDGVIEKGKPHPAVYRHAAERLGITPQDCVVVEDSDNGIEAAKRAGMHCIGYRNDSPEADGTAHGPEELREMLLDLAEGKGF